MDRSKQDWTQTKFERYCREGKQGKKIVQKARTFKLTQDLGSKSVAEKFELEI